MVKTLGTLTKAAVQQQQICVYANAHLLTTANPSG